MPAAKLIAGGRRPFRCGCEEWEDVELSRGGVAIMGLGILQKVRWEDWGLEREVQQSGRAKGAVCG